MKTEYNHGDRLGISNIWQAFPGEWHWSNRAGQGTEHTFEAAVEAAEAALVEDWQAEYAIWCD